MWPPSQRLINAKSLHLGCQRAVGRAADKVAPGVCCTMKRCVISVIHIHRSVANHSRSVRGLCWHTCVHLCVYIPVGDYCRGNPHESKLPVSGAVSAK